MGRRSSRRTANVHNTKAPRNPRAAERVYCFRFFIFHPSLARYRLSPVSTVPQRREKGKNRPSQSCVPTGTTPSRRISPKPNTGIEAFKSAARLPTVLPLKASAGSVVCGYLYPALTAIGVLGVQPLNVFFSPFFFPKKKNGCFSTTNQICTK